MKKNSTREVMWFQCRTRLCGWCKRRGINCDTQQDGFNAARGFVGGAITFFFYRKVDSSCFNAARGFVGGAITSLAALAPLGGKSPFGKSPEI